MAGPVNTGMDKSEMKKLLGQSKQAPVRCAVGVGSDSATALLMLSRTKQGRALEADLKKEFPDAKNTRFGTAFVDTDDNPKLVKFTLNRPVTGIAKRLTKTLKGTGFSRAVILSEDGSLVESFEDEDDAAEATPAAAAPSDAPAPAVAPPPPPPPPTAGPSPEDKAALIEALTKRLAALAARIPAASGGNAARQAELAKLARDANVNIKTGNTAYAENSLAQLEQALSQPVPDGPGPAMDAASLSKRLAALIGRIPAATANSPENKAALSALAAEAAGLIKGTNLAAAVDRMARLERELNQLGGAADTAGTPPNATPDATPNLGSEPALAASRNQWTKARAAVTGEIDKLRAAIAEAYDGQPYLGDVLAGFSRTVAPVMEKLNGQVDGALDALVAETDAAKRPDKLAAAKATVKETLAFAMGDKLIADLDGNPFVPLKIRGAATEGLAAVAKALQ